MSKYRGAPKNRRAQEAAMAAIPSLSATRSSSDAEGNNTESLDDRGEALIVVLDPRGDDQHGRVIEGDQ